MTTTQYLGFLAVALVAFASCASARPDKVVCYYGSWAVYRPGDGKFAVENIDPFRCTHAIYSFVGIGADGSVRILDAWNEIDLGALRRFNALKQRNPALKTLIAIGGWNEGSATFSRVAADAKLRQRFADSALAFLQQHGFDGFDLDWEYPAQRGGAVTDRTNVNLMLATLRKTFDATGRKYLLTAAVAASASATDASYDVPNFARHLDFINLMAYDFHGAFDGRTGHNAPLYSSSTHDPLTVDAAVRAWIARGAPRSKLVLGLAVYGRSFTVSNTMNHGLNNPGYAGTAGPYTREAGMLGYNEICMMQKQGGWSMGWDDAHRVPYMYKGNQWVGYDDERSIRLKAEYAVEMNLGGAMIWSIETDDFHGACGAGAYPILTAINEVIFGGGSGGGSGPPVVTTVAPTTTTTATTMKPPVSGGGDDNPDDCNVRCFHRDEEDCNIYYYVERNERLYKFRCPATTVFNLRMRACDHPWNVPACL